MNNDVAISIIRTTVATAVGTVLSWAVRHGLPVGSIDTAQAVAYVTPLCISVYYAAVRAAEKQWPQVGWLLGIAKAPVYPPAP